MKNKVRLLAALFVAALFGAGCSAVNQSGSPRASYAKSAGAGAAIGTIGFIGGPEVGIPTTAGGAVAGVAYAAINNNITKTREIDLADDAILLASTSGMSQIIGSQGGSKVIVVTATPLAGDYSQYSLPRHVAVAVYVNGAVQYYFTAKYDMTAAKIKYLANLKDRTAPPMPDYSTVRWQTFPNELPPPPPPPKPAPQQPKLNTAPPTAQAAPAPQPTGPTLGGSPTPPPPAVVPPVAPPQPPPVAPPPPLPPDSSRNPPQLPAPGNPQP